MQDAAVIADRSRSEFSAGLVRPRIYVSTGAIKVLDEAALSAVLSCMNATARAAATRCDWPPAGFLPGRCSYCPSSATSPNVSRRSPSSAPMRVRSTWRRRMIRPRSRDAAFSDLPESSSSSGIDPARVDYLLRGAQLALSCPPVSRVRATQVLLLLVAVADSSFDG